MSVDGRYSLAPLPFGLYISGDFVNRCAYIYFLCEYYVGGRHSLVPDMWFDMVSMLIFFNDRLQ